MSKLHRKMKWQKIRKISRTWTLLFQSFHWGSILVLQEIEASFKTFSRKIKK